MFKLLTRKIIISRLHECFFYKKNSINLQLSNVLNQIQIVGPGSLSVIITSAFFIGLVFSLQIVKEFLYLNAISLVGSMLTISFLRELSPVLTSVILIGKVGSYFTSELATMKVTEQIDALYILGISPINYLVIPRVIALILMLPILNFFSFVTSLFSSAFICFTLYNIDPRIFFKSVFYILSIIDIMKSSLKTFIFGFFIALISCIFGLTARGGAKGVGTSTTSSVVISLLSVFILDFILSYYMFNKLDSSLKIL
uniref:ABC transporter permease n=1 Tax=Acrosorium ciliolatum TaxID=1550622 RepID=A0A1Z1M207_9FLOR|nr:hypothetical protein [Acrosorium ciliolatum]ARW59932.1 hypothetical protein [Acrosorium ciliolatum]